MSALRPKADTRQRDWNVRYVPIADMPFSFVPLPSAQFPT